jgi:signal transduction histidine kinase
MHPLPCRKAGTENAERARFEALRLRVFQEMSRGATRWRLTWILPFHILVILLLVVRGESTQRAIIQGSCVAIIATLFVLQTFFQDVRLATGSFLFGIASYFTFCATTGCLASPMLVSLGVMICVASLSMHRPGWLRPLIFFMLIAGLATLALLSRTSIGRLAGPLAPTLEGPSIDHVCLGLVAAIFTMIGIYRMGWTMTSGYERAALELAERREEVCSENEDRTRALEGMAARLAHEVKNPLAAIKGLSTHMARNASDAKTAERLAIVAAEADRLQAIVDGFLSFSRGLDDLEVAPTKPYEIARELGVLLETRAEEAGITFETGGDPELVVDADPRKIRQALLNIVLNAIQASPRGSHVHVAVERDCEGARITVRDEGVGMTPEVLDRIRKPYFTTKEGGTGLGLAVARGLVEQHGGSLEFKSAPRMGTTVTMRLPVKAKIRAKLPNPVRTFRADAVEPETVSAPVAAGVR